MLSAFASQAAVAIENARLFRRTDEALAARVGELPNIPGCSDGFNAIWVDLMEMTTVTHIGMARCETIPIKSMLAYAEQRLRADPHYLLCDKPSCLSCRTREH